MRILPALTKRHFSLYINTLEAELEKEAISPKAPTNIATQTHRAYITKHSKNTDKNMDAKPKYLTFWYHKKHYMITIQGNTWHFDSGIDQRSIHQRDVARAIGMGDKTVERWKTGRQKPQPAILFLLQAQVMGWIVPQELRHVGFTYRGTT